MKRALLRQYDNYLDILLYCRKDVNDIARVIRNSDDNLILREIGTKEHKVKAAGRLRLRRNNSGKVSFLEFHKYDEKEKDDTKTWGDYYGKTFLFPDKNAETVLKFAFNLLNEQDKKRLIFYFLCPYAKSVMEMVFDFAEGLTTNNKYFLEVTK